MNILPITGGVNSTAAKKSSISKKQETPFAKMLSDRMDTYESGKKAISQEQKDYLQKKYNIKSGNMFFYSDETQSLLKELEEMGIISASEWKEFGNGVPIRAITSDMGQIKKLEGFELMRDSAFMNPNPYEAFRDLEAVQKHYADTYPGDRKGAQSLYERSAMYQRIADALKEVFEL